MIKQPHVVAIEVAEALIEYMEEREFNVKRFFTERQFNYDLEQDLPFLPFEIFSDLFVAGATFLADDYLGLHVGQTVSTRHWGQLGYLILSGDDGIEAIRYMDRYARLITNAMDTRFEIEGEHLICSFELLPVSEGGCANDGYSHHILDYFVSAVRNLGTFMSNGVFKYREIHFQYEPPINPVNPDIYQEILGCPCYFGRAKNRIIVGIESLQFLSHYRDPRLKKVLERNAQAVLQHLAGDDEFVRELKHYLANALKNGMPTLAEATAHFGISERTLQRRLAKQNISFQDVIDELRQELAKNYMQNNYSLLDIALLLGYSEQSAFHRAFKRWTGLSPSKYVKQNGLELKKRPDA